MVGPVKPSTKTKVAVAHVPARGTIGLSVRVLVLPMVFWGTVWSHIQKMRGIPSRAMFDVVFFTFSLMGRGPLWSDRLSSNGKPQAEKEAAKLRKKLREIERIEEKLVAGRGLFDPTVLGIQVVMFSCFLFFWASQSNPSGLPAQWRGGSEAKGGWSACGFPRCWCRRCL